VEGSAVVVPSCSRRRHLCRKLEVAAAVWDSEAETGKVTVSKEWLLCLKGDILAKAGRTQDAVSAYVRNNARFCPVA